MVAELHVNAVRALLVHDIDEHLRLIGEIDRDDSVNAYGLFYKTVFERAVRQRFGDQAMRGDVIRFVARVRAGAPDLDVKTAERLLYAMLGDESALRDLTEDDSALVGPLLLELSDGLEPEALLTDARERAEEIERQLPL